MKNKMVAALLAFFLGSLGFHKFYLGQTFKGLLYLFFCWTAIPGIIAFFESIILVITSDENFNLKYNAQFLLNAQNSNPTIIIQNGPNEQAQNTNAAPQKSIAEQLDELNALHVKGAITDEEFNRLKSKLIA